ncbi:hypothetical protein [Amedibacterium intestinale]|uniref:hypothetical protein n=1 Tax=Amedibacterium intestinale TaxID=2583452 RepID=UPI001373A42A|nr:hypothetical protein A9CBEGH2_00510 [Amedibacterium intestinale]
MKLKVCTKPRNSEQTRTMSRQRTDESGSQCIHSEEMEITEYENRGKIIGTDVTFYKSANCI